MTGHRTYLDIASKPLDRTRIPRVVGINSTYNPELIERVRRAKAAGVQEDFYVAA
jgi:hypothetical protein